MQRPVSASLVLVLAACGAGAAPLPLNEACVSSGGAPFRDTILVAAAGPVDPAYPRAEASFAARFLGAQLGPAAPGADCRVAESGLGAFRLTAGDSLLAPTDPGASRPLIRLRRFAPADDPRDWIDRGADVVVTADPATLEYAARRPELRLIPLAWSAVYVLLSPPGSPLPVDPNAALRAELARDAVRVEARPAEAGYWWDGGQRCSAPPAGPRNAAPGIAIPAGDPVARALAERLVALSPAGLTRVIAYPPARFDSVLALAAGAAILPLPRMDPGHCAPGGWALAPLIETRETAVVRSGVPPFLITVNGTIRFLSGGAP